MRKRELIAENKKLKNEVEDLKRKLMYEHVHRQLVEVKLLLKEENEVR